jgi:hypothetical protein
VPNWIYAPGVITRFRKVIEQYTIFWLIIYLDFRRCDSFLLLTLSRRVAIRFDRGDVNRTGFKNASLIQCARSQMYKVQTGRCSWLNLYRISVQNTSFRSVFSICRIGARTATTNWSVQCRQLIFGWIWWSFNVWRSVILWRIWSTLLEKFVSIRRSDLCGLNVCRFGVCCLT